MSLPRRVCPSQLELLIPSRLAKELAFAAAHWALALIELFGAFIEGLARSFFTGAPAISHDPSLDNENYTRAQRRKPESKK
jgi:hypothetical protein